MLEAIGATESSAIALDRVIAINYPDPDLNITYTHDDPEVPFSKGRLTRIARHGEVVDYRYDRFGRILQDGALSYGYDANDNPTSLLYPGGVEAVTTYDYVDRPATLLARRAGQPDHPLVTAAAYLPARPLSSLTLGNGLTETRSYTNRYFPSSIIAGSHLSWSYSTDAVGNILSITDTLNAGNNRIYAYQDHQYFLTLGNGPWGLRAWTYDKIGNRLTETLGTVTDTYSYPANGTGGNTPQISQIIPSAGPASPYSYDQAGNLLNNGTLSFSYGADRRMSRSGAAGSGTTYAYDGRGFLSRSALASADYTRPTYSSDGLLHHRFTHQPSNQARPERSSDLYVFYFAGRPVATLDHVTEGMTVGGSATTSTWQYLTVDHLGTPILVINQAGAQVWQGGFEPFGADYKSSPTVLRFPGQWADATWNGNKDIGLYYNVHRWYVANLGRYSQPDPLQLDGSDPNPFRYASSRPTSLVDPLGLRVVPVQPPLPPAAPPQTLPLVCPRPQPAPSISAAPRPWSVLGAFVTMFFMAKPTGNQTLEEAGIIFPVECDKCPPDVHEHCLKLYVICIQNIGRHKFEQGKSCENCVHICRREGLWPFEFCRLNYYPRGV